MEVYSSRWYLVMVVTTLTISYWDAKLFLYNNVSFAFYLEHITITRAS